MRVADSAAADAERFMGIALQSAERGMAAGGPPVGACLIRDGTVIAAGQNAVISELDVTAHAEIVVIREACRQARSLSLENTTLFVTIEPCPMCVAACHYAGIGEIIYGASIQALHAVTGDELCVAAEQLLAPHSSLKLSGGLLAADAEVLIKQWQSLRQGRRA
jgi:tRNA(Arg) A34 adenosine deaminase TadA